MKKSYLFLFACLFSIGVYSQSDLCVDAVEVFPTLPSPLIQQNGTFSGATISSLPPTCAPNASQDVWFKFTATEMMNTITVSDVNGVDVGTEVYDSDCNGTAILCSNSGSSYGDYSSYNNYIIGHTYYIRFYNPTTTLTGGSFVFRLEKYAEPVNNECANAITVVPEVETCTNTVRRSFGGSTMSPATSCTPNASQDIWFKFVATHKMVLISFSGNGEIDPACELYDGSCSGNLLICRNYNGLGASDGMFYTNLVIGNTYYIRAVNTYSRPAYSFNFLCLLGYPAPANDLCADATQLTPNSGCSFTPGTFSGAALDGSPTSSCSLNPSQDVWYKFTATNATSLVSLSGTAGISNGLEIYEGSCAGPMVVCRDNNGIGTGEIINYHNFVVGHEYYIRVVNATGKPLSLGSFTICVQDPTLGEAEIATKSIQISPNPAADFIEVSNVDATVNYELYNQLGQMVGKDYFRSNQINIQTLQAGIYLLRITDGSTSIIKRIIKK